MCNVPPDLTRRLEDARRQLDIAYEQARAVGYRSGSPEMDALQGAEDTFQHTRRLWQDAHHQQRSPRRPATSPTDDPTGQQPTDPAGRQTGEAVDLTRRDNPVDLDSPTRLDTGC